MGDSPPQHALEATSFATAIANKYAHQNGRVEDLFAAFAGLVSSSDKELAARCLIALDEALQCGASGPA